MVAYLFSILVILGSIGLSIELDIDDQNTDNITYDSYCKDFQDLGVKGHVQIGSRPQNKIFYWYFPHQDQDNNSLTVYLGGRLGFSSIVSMFKGIGPCTLLNGHMTKNEHSWSNFSNLLFIENSLGTGLSTSNIYDIPSSVISLKKDYLEFFERWFILDLLHKKDNKTKIVLVASEEGGLQLPYIASSIMDLTKKDFALDGMILISGLVDPWTNYQTLLNFAHDQNLISTWEYYKYMPIQSLCYKAMEFKYIYPLNTTIDKGICDSYQKKIYTKQDGSGSPRFNPMNFSKKDFENPEYNMYDVEKLFNSEFVKDKIGFVYDNGKYEIYNHYVNTMVFSEYLGLGNFSSEYSYQGLTKMGYRLLLISGDKDFTYNTESVKAWLAKIIDTKSIVVDYEDDWYTCYHYQSIEWDIIKNTGRYISIDKPSKIYESSRRFVLDL